MKRRLAPLVLTMFAFPALTHGQDPATLEENDDRQIELLSLIEQVRDNVDREFVIDPRLRGIRVPTIEQELDYESLLGNLRLSGYVAVETADQILIVPEQEMRVMPTRILQPDDSRVSDHEVVTRIIAIPPFGQERPSNQSAENQPDAPASRSSAPQLVPVLRPMMSNSAQLAAVPGSNSLILVDRYDNVRRITAVIEEIIDQIDD